MKKLILISCLALLAPVASAQEDIAFSLGGALVADVDLGRKQHNLDRCTSNGQPEGCTQAQVCVAAGVIGGASCTVPDATAAGQRIYPDSAPGRNAFIANEMVRTQTLAFKERQKSIDIAKARAFCSSASQIQLNAICTAFGLGAGCFVCPLQ